jgi:small ligand-binding sensory domain FIST
MSIDFLRTAQASGAHWGSIVKAILTALGPLPSDVNFGVVYGTLALAEDLPSIMTFLRETTPIKHWTVAVGAGVIGPISAVRDRPSLVVMVATLPAGSFQRLDSWQEPGRGQFLAQQKSWLAGQDMPIALLHGDGGGADLPPMIEDLTRATHSFAIGGVVPFQPGGLSGVLLGAPLTIVSGLTQSCHPIGESVRVTEMVDDIIAGLDGRPALEVLTEMLDPELAEDLRRIAGVVHVGLPVIGDDRADYLVRPLLAIDPTRGWIAVGGRLSVGDRLIFVKRDADGARQDMQRMLDGLRQRLGGRTIKGGIYISCVTRGEQMFGSDDVEPAMISRSLGDFPLIGLFGQGEFCHDRLYSDTGVLALLLS